MKSQLCNLWPTRLIGAVVVVIVVVVIVVVVVVIVIVVVIVVVVVVAVVAGTEVDFGHNDSDISPHFEDKICVRVFCSRACT